MVVSSAKASVAASPSADTPRVAGNGLDSAEAAHRLQTYGPNRPPSARPRRLHTRVWAQVRDPMILLLLAAGTLTFALEDYRDTAIIAAVVVFNTLIGVVQEIRSDRAIAALHALTTPLAKVRRDGTILEMSTEEIVPGDSVWLDAGDVVPADGVLVTARDLQIDQSMMTGESVPVMLLDGEKVTGGTLVTRGRAVFTVTETGADSGLGRLATMMLNAPTQATPLQRRLSRLSRVLVGIVGLLTAVVVGIGLAQGRPLSEMAIIGVSLAVAAVPESLPAVVAVALALGAHRMALRNAVVRRLPAVETLGSVTVIATDKTGTITEGRMVVERLWTANAGYAVDGRGYDPAGSIRPDHAVPGDSAVRERRDADRDRLLRDVALCNDARLVRDGTQWSVIGDPLEGALLVVATKGGHDTASLDTAWTRTAEQPFDHLTRRMTTTHRHTNGRELVVCKGAPEAVLPALEPGLDVRRATLAAEELAARGYRVIAVADHENAGPTPSGDVVLTLAGLVAIDDPPREHAGAVVAACRRAGIRLLLVTGDHPGTAHAIAQRVGILDAEDGKLHGSSVFARVRPEEKVEIVQSLQRVGEVVAMIGDGVNDAPALRCANIGVAAGLGGTEVARQAADLVLLDDDLSTVVSAVEEGRRIYANIRAFLLYAVSGGLAEVGVMLLGPFLGIALPLLPAQILWINLMTHGLTGVAFGAEPADPAEMARPPRPPEQSVFTPRFTYKLGIAAASLMATSLTVGVLAGSGAEQRTAIFLTLGLGQLAVALAIRSRPRAQAPRSWGLPVAIAGAAALLLLALTPPLQALLGTRPLDAITLGTALLAAAAPGLVIGLMVRRERRRLLASSEPGVQRPHAG
jgi:Ca2+-transporting ATPase